ALAHEQPALAKMSIDLGQQPRAKVVLFQQPTKIQYRGLVWDDILIGAHTSELAHRNRIVERLFGTGVRQVVPLLKTINAKHALQRQRRTTASRTSFRMMRFDQLAQPPPGNNIVHLRQKLLSARLLAFVEI